MNDFPFTYQGVTLEPEEDGLWVSIDEFEPRWISSRVLNAIQQSGILYSRG